MAGGSKGIPVVLDISRAGMGGLPCLSHGSTNAPSILEFDMSSGPVG